VFNTDLTYIIVPLTGLD